MPGSFPLRDESSDASDSDIEIIPSSAFYKGRLATTPSKPGSSSNVSGTQQAKLERPNFSPEAQIAGHAAISRTGQSASSDALQKAMYGKQPTPSWMNAAGPSRAPAQNPFGIHAQQPLNGSTGGYVYPSSYNRVNGVVDIPGLPGRAGAYPGGSMQNPVQPLGYTLNNGTYPAGNMQNSLQPHGYTLNNAPGPMYGFAMNRPGSSNSFDSSLANSSSDELGDMIRRGGNNQNEIADYLGLQGRMNGAMEDQLDYIMNDPRNTHQDIKSLLENIRPDEDLPPEDREGTPEGLKYPLVR